MMRRSVTISMALALVLSACSGGGGEPEIASVSTTEAASESQSEATTTTTAATGTDDPVPVPSTGEGTGTATVGDTTWEFSMSGDGREMCNPDFSGFFIVSMFGQGENGAEVALTVNAPNSGGPAVVQAGGTVISEELWIADVSVHGDYPLQELPKDIGATAIVDGNTISGSGVFYEDRSLAETRQSGEPYETGVLDGTFSVTCPGG